MSFLSSNFTNYTYNSSSNIVVWTIPVLPKGQLDSIKLTVTTVQLGTITNGAGINGQEVDINQRNNYAQVSTQKLGETFLFPTLFTPNGDGINDYFEIKGLQDYPDNEIQIFNRWGNQVYHQTGYMTQGNLWDGSSLNEGTYFYILKVNINGFLKEYGGYTTIIRSGK